MFGAVMLVKQLMSHRPASIDADDTVQEAAARMRALDVGALPVSAHGRFVGMVTDRDLTIRATASGADPRRVRVRQVMTPGLITCFEDERVDDAAALMAHHGVRRLAVVNRELELVGFLSIDDIAVSIADAEWLRRVLSQAFERVSARRTAEPTT